MTTILIVTNGPLARKPRVVKEATTLGHSGYAVTVLGIRNHRPSVAQDHLLAVLAAHPAATLAWCNQAPDERLPDGSGRDLARAVPAVPAPVLYPFGHDISQAFGALHANGAMVLRLPPAPGCPTPAIPFTGIEPYRERLFPGPLLYIPESLARFTLTRSTPRWRDANAWAALQTALFATFIRAVDPVRDVEIWAHAHAQFPSTAGSLIQAELADASCRRLLTHACLAEWLRWLLGTLRHPHLALSAQRCRHSPCWSEFAESTAARLSNRA